MKKILTGFCCIVFVLIAGNVWAKNNNVNSKFGFLSTGIGITPKAAKKIGTPWLRPHIGQAVWGNIETKKGTFNWSKMDKEIKLGQAQKLQALITIWPYAMWDQNVCHKNIKKAKGFEDQLPIKRGAPCDYNEYKVFLTKLVERYNNDGKDDMPGLKYGVKYWEILNEPEMKGDLVFFKGTAKEYFTLLKTSYTTIKKADSKSKILHGGMAGVNKEMKTFWKKVFKLGGGKYFDIGNIHSISSASDDLNASGYKSFLRQNKIKKPFWITEIQISSGEIMTPNGPMIRSDEEQAAEIIKGYARAFAVGAKKNFYTIYQADVNVPDDLKNSALIYVGTKRPAYYALKTLAKKTDYFSKITKLSSAQYKFKVNKKDIYVLWTAGFDILPTELQTGTLKITDMSGQVTIASAASIVLNNNPIFVEKIN